MRRDEFIKKGQLLHVQTKNESFKAQSELLCVLKTLDSLLSSWTDESLMDFPKVYTALNKIP